MNEVLHRSSIGQDRLTDVNQFSESDEGTHSIHTSVNAYQADDVTLA